MIPGCFRGCNHFPVFSHFFSNFFSFLVAYQDSGQATPAHNVFGNLHLGRVTSYRSRICPSTTVSVFDKLAACYPPSGRAKLTWRGLSLLLFPPLKEPHSSPLRLLLEEGSGEELYPPLHNPASAYATQHNRPFSPSCLQATKNLGNRNPERFKHGTLAERGPHIRFTSRLVALLSPTVASPLARNPACRKTQ